jgi:ABC-2 type transport system permease protein
MWNNVWAVTRREYLQRVRSKWFIAATLGAPVFMAAMIAVPGYMASRGERSSRSLAIVDGTQVLFDRLAPALEDGGWDLEEERWRADVVGDLRTRAELGEIGGFLMLDEFTLETGEAILYTKSHPGPVRELALRTAIARAAMGYRLEQTGSASEELMGGGQLAVQLLSEDGAGMREPEFMVAYIGALLLYIVILLYAVAVMRATLEEKTSRIVEVIVSAMKPWHLMLGKIVGVCGVSLTQMAVWVLIGVVAVLSGVPMLVAARPEFANLGELSSVLPGFGMLVLFVGYFVFGFFMYSGLYAAIGAMCNSDEEAQQAQLPVMIVLIVPITLVTGVIQEPTTTSSVALSLFPLFSPVLMWGRIAAGGVPAWQVGASFVLMALAVLAIAWVAGRIYRVGILMAGKRPTLPELWRWVREA